jgi:cytidylate kinase
MAVITISRQMGSLGTEIAQDVAGKLKYKYLDKEGIEQGLTTHGLAVSEVEKFDEKSLPFWVNWQAQGRKFFHAMRMVIYEAARRGNVVIIGRGGQLLLKGIPGVIHIRIIAPFKDRVQRLMAKDGGNEKELLRTLKQSDRDSGRFIRIFFDADWENADLYDLTINTHYIPVDLAVDMILRAIPAVEAMKDTQRSRERLDDLILQMMVETVLLNADVRNIRVEVAGGVVTLSGNVSSSSEVRSFVNLISGIEGVKKVNSNMAIYTHIGT